MQAPTVPFACYTPFSIAHDLKKDADMLRKAMKGIGTDEKTLITILANRNWEERAGIIREYTTHVGRDLIKDIKSETSGNFEKGLVALLTDPAIFDVEALIKAMKGVGTNEAVLTEILVTRNNAQKARISQIYATQTGKSLKHAISSETSGDYKHLLEELLDPRDESWIVDPARAAVDAEALYHAGEGKIGTDEKTFIKILANRNFLQIREIARIYETIHKKHSLEKAIESEFSGDIRSALKSIVLFSQDSFAYFARVLHKSMAGVGTNDETLIRNVVYCQPFITAVSKAYHVVFGKTLQYDIEKDCSGDYKKLLIDIKQHSKGKNYRDLPVKAQKSLNYDISSSETSADYKNSLESLFESRVESWIVDQASAGVDTETLVQIR
ncbi:hypothetical protein PPL_08292 [Heterostelium album PN500]|uniref:Annexin n=1 Tax=Heterostelium pallidum (strain ATCC 26659 / Pp 5 / PN500) TaxID=670386 RepID=D3BHS8_HETP5|nr:hypothetical protein PPL_08292 [Heterostelium album PN500]EFA78828.1 hypothetical protein PPL_08292 [Heterostelium album PN500]|eukprot:XP_020430952.1 hypothetical protein PPL_08292 [Heterostelium album PN500]